LIAFLSELGGARFVLRERGQKLLARAVFDALDSYFGRPRPA
jgi:hypothetical protein